MSHTRNNGCLISAKIWFIAIILGVGFFALILILINFSRPPRTKVVAVTAALTVFPSMSETLTPTAAEIFSTDLPNVTLTLLPNTIGVGAFVQVSGTGGDGLRLRKGPGLNTEMQFLGLDGELFRIGDGPVDADGYTWWFVVGSYDESRQGWAAADFLEFVPNQ